jgi:hypothetical protein
MTEGMPITVRFICLVFTGGMLAVALGIGGIRLLNRLFGCEGTANVEPETAGGLVSALGALGFLGGCFLAFLCPGKANGFFGLAVVSLAAAFGDILFQAWRKRWGWQLTEARCVERQLMEVFDGEGGRAWAWRLVCEYEHGGVRYRVVPRVRWIDFISQKGARRFLARRVSPEGVCQLRFNPKKPQEAELAGRGLLGKLLYTRPFPKGKDNCFRCPQAEGLAHTSPGQRPGNTGNY